MSKILITGINGFVGRYLADNLRAGGHEVVGTSTSGGGLGVFVCRLGDLSGLIEILHQQQPDVIFHCAAISTPTHHHAIDYYDVNVIGTKNVLRAASAISNRPRFIFLSTAGVYGNQIVDTLHEDLQPRPVHDYGMSKWCAECWVSQAQETCDITIVRPFNLVGFGQSEQFIFPKLAQSFAAGIEEIELGNLDVFRDFLDIHSACRILERIMQEPRTYGQCLNLSTGRDTSLRQLLDLFCDQAGYQIKVSVNQEFVRKNEVWKLLGSTKKLATCLGGGIEFRPIEELVCEMYTRYVETIS